MKVYAFLFIIGPSIGSRWLPQAGAVLVVSDQDDPSGPP